MNFSGNFFVNILTDKMQVFDFVNLLTDKMMQAILDGTGDGLIMKGNKMYKPMFR